MLESFYLQLWDSVVFSSVYFRINRASVVWAFLLLWSSSVQVHFVCYSLVCLDGEETTGFLGVFRSLLKTFTHRIAKWVLVGKEWANFSLTCIFLNWETCMSCGLMKDILVTPWGPLPTRVLKFNVDEAAKGKPGPGVFRGALHNDKGGSSLFILLRCRSF